MTIRAFGLPAFFLFALGAGCANVGDDGTDGVEASDSEVNAAPSIADEGAVAVANGASLELMTRTIEAGGLGVTTSAARSIIAHRAGPDGKAGTADDRTIDSLAALDAISGVGSVTIRRFRDFARLVPVIVDGKPLLSLAELERLVTGSWSLSARCSDRYTATITGNYGVGRGGPVTEHEFSYARSASITLQARRRADAKNAPSLGYEEGKGFWAGWYAYELAITKVSDWKSNLTVPSSSFDLAMVLNGGAGGARGYGGNSLRVDDKKNLVFSSYQTYQNRQSDWSWSEGTFSCEAATRL